MKRFIILFTMLFLFTSISDVRANELQENTNYSDEEIDYINGSELSQDEIENQKRMEPKLHRLPTNDLDIESYNTKDTRVGVPAKWDARNYSLVSNVKNQYQNGVNWGTCWATSMSSIMETAYIKAGLGDNSTDFSEGALAYFTYNAVNDPLGNTNGDKFSCDSNWITAGGTASSASLSLAKWVGPTWEGYAPYLEMANGYNDHIAYNYDSAHVKNILYVPSTNRDRLKQLLLKYGSFSYEMYYDSKNHNYNTAAYVNLDYNGFYADNHEVAIVGWDDQYSKYNFKHQPTYDGAWIVKNSFGPNWGNNGYFYVSYEDTSFSGRGEEPAVFASVDKVKYNYNYQYDGSSNPLQKEVQSGSSLVNVYEMNGSDYESLEAVSFLTYSTGVNYEIQLYHNPVSTDPRSGTPMLIKSQKGYLEDAGYYQIELDQTATVKKGDKIAVEVKVSKEDNSNVFVGIDKTAKGFNGLSEGYSSINNTESNQSFIIDSNNLLNDLHPYTESVRMKVYTNISSDASIEDAIIEIENPVVDSLQSNNLLVKGWELSNASDTVLKFFIDGNLCNEEMIRSNQEGLEEIIDNFGGSELNPNPAFESNIDISNLSGENHFLSAVLYNSSGTIIATKVVPFSKIASVLSLDKPSTDDILKNKLQFEGWFVSNVINKNIEIYLDNQLQNTSVTRYERQDVFDYIGLNFGGKENNSKPAYKGEIDISNLEDGNHNLKINLVDNDRNILESKDVVFIKNTKEKGRIAIDTPADQEQLNKGTLNVSGWENSTTATSKVKIYVDGEEKVSEASRHVRSDATSISGEYGGASVNQECGYSATIDTKKLSKGNHTIKVVLTDENDNVIAENERTIAIINHKGRIAIDTPADQEQLNKGTLNVSGWENSTTATSKVKIYVDGEEKVSEASRHVRNDATSISGEYGGASVNQKCGYSATINTKKLSKGNHTIKVVLTDENDEVIAENERIITLINHKGRIAIDTPADKEQLSKGLLYISGWENSTTAISKVKIYVDGEEKISEASRHVRSDATSISGEYGGASVNQKCGYNATIDTKQLSKGNHTIKVVLTDENDEIIAENERTIAIINHKGRIAIDTPADQEQLSKGLLHVSGWENSTIATSKVKIYVDGEEKVSEASRHVRSDATSISGEYGGASVNQKCGYSATINTKQLSKGNHTIKVVLTDENDDVIVIKSILIKII